MSGTVLGWCVYVWAAFYMIAFGAFATQNSSFSRRESSADIAVKAAVFQFLSNAGPMAHQYVKLKWNG